jgi:hypothetical protein
MTFFGVKRTAVATGFVLYRKTFNFVLIKTTSDEKNYCFRNFGRVHLSMQSIYMPYLQQENCPC